MSKNMADSGYIPEAELNEIAGHDQAGGLVLSTPFCFIGGVITGAAAISAAISSGCPTSAITGRCTR